MTAINLQSFCATHDVREYLHQPFVIDGHTYATDGRIIVRVPGGGEDSDVPAKLAQSVRKIFAVEYADFGPLPAIPKRIECEVCGGTGTGAEDGILDMCPGTGAEDDNCDMCTGTGESPTVVAIGCGSFQAHFIRMIAGLPNPRISVASMTEPAAFAFDGGEGRVMPYLQRAKR